MTTITRADQKVNSTLMIDHPGWVADPDGRAHRAFRAETTTWVLTCDLVSATPAPTIEPVHLTTATAD